MRQGACDGVRNGVEETPRLLARRRRGAAARAEQTKQFIHHVKAVVGASMRVTVVDPGAIDRSLGKAKRVLDMRPKS